MKYLLLSICAAVLVFNTSAAIQFTPGEPVPNAWWKATTLVSDLEWAEDIPGEDPFPSPEEAMRAGLVKNLGIDPENWPEDVKAAMAHQLAKTDVWNDDDFNEIPKPNDPFEFWLSMFNSGLQPLSPASVELGNLDLYFEQVFSLLCLYIQSDVDGNIIQPEIPDPPEAPPLLLKMQEMSPEEIGKLAQDPDFQKLIQSYQEEMQAFYQSMGDPEQVMNKAYKASQERWLAYNKRIEERVAQNLESKFYPFVNLLIQGYGTSPVGSMTAEEGTSLMEAAEAGMAALQVQFNQALLTDTERFRRSFLTNLESRFGNHEWQEDNTQHTLQYQLSLEQPAIEYADDFSTDSGPSGTLSTTEVEGYVGFEKITGPNENRSRKTVELRLKSSLGEEIRYDDEEPAIVLASDPSFLIACREDPYNEDGIELYLVPRALPEAFGHSLVSYFAAGGKGSGISEREINTKLKEAFKSAFVAAAVEVYSNLPPITSGAEDEVVATLDLTARANPREVFADGKNQVTILLKTLEYPAGSDADPKPYPNTSIELSLSKHGGREVGRLSANTVTTNATGEATVTYHAPNADDLDDGAIDAITITARVQELGLEDTAYVSFKSDTGTLFAEPHYKGVVSDKAVVPADSRYPARIQLRAEGDDLRLLSGEKVSFSIKSDNPQGILESRNGEKGTIVSVVANNNGFAEVLYRFNQDSQPAIGFNETITAKTDKMLRPVEGKVSAGIDLSITGIRNLYEGKGKVNAGEQIPVEVIVKDAAQPDADDLRPVLSYWGSGGSNGTQTISVRLKIEPLGNLPKYLLTKMSAESYPAPVFTDTMELRSFEGKTGNTLWIRNASMADYSGLPKVEARYEGKNYYMLTVELVDGLGNPLPDPDPANNIGYLSIPTGVAADAFTIFFLENPLGPNTPEAKFFRTVLNLMGFGSVLSLADAAHAVNTGDMDALANVVVGELTDKITDAIGDSGGAAAQFANLYAQVSVAEQVATTFIDSKAPISGLQKKFVETAFQRSGSSGKKLIIVTGTGNQYVVEKNSGKPVKALEGIISGDPGDPICSIKRGAITVLIVPEDFDYEAVDAQSVDEFSSSW
ncbi:MAG: hypothetical protein AB3N63_16430 [Puniceicoccaceae bacterium]